MLPVAEVHHITEAAHHAIASSRDLLGFTVHQVVRIVTDLLCFSLFLLTEAIAEPAHHEAWFKGERLVLPYAGYGMTVYTDASVWIGLSAVGIKFMLPEAATEYRGFARLACADTDGAELTVTTADGSEGVPGFVTDALPEAGAYTHFYTCGPEPMLRAVYRATVTDGQFSFEERMGCGFGACMGCSCHTVTGNKRICKEGPVLRKGEILWQK